MIEIRIAFALFFLGIATLVAITGYEILRGLEYL